MSQILTLARDNCATEIRQVVQSGICPVDYANPIGQTALHVAALHGNVESITSLLELGLDPNIQNSRGLTALHFAAAANARAPETCQALVSAGADPYLADTCGSLPYERAETDELRKALGGPDPRLFQFAEDGKDQDLEALLKELRSERAVSFVDPDGRTMLHLASAKGHRKVVELLLANKADPNAPDRRGNTPLHVAVREGNRGTAELLLHGGASPKLPNLRVNAYTGGDWLSRESHQALEPLDQTPLHVAVEEGDTATAALLLEAGAEVNAVDYDGKTPLHLALEEGDTDMAELLLGQLGVDVAVGNGEYHSPLHFLAARGRPALIRRLLDLRAPPDAANPDGWTPLHVAARTHSSESVEALLAAGCRVDLRNSAGNTPLHLAAINGRAEICRLLRESCPDVCHVRNSEDNTPAEVAKDENIMRMLSV